MNTSSFNQSLVDVIRSYGLLQDRMPGDQLTLPNQWIDIKLNVNDLILSDTINYSLEALHKNWLYLLAYSVIPTNDIPDIQLYTHVIMDKGTGISWVNSANDYASRNSEIGGIKNIIKIQNTAVPDNYNIIAATTTNLMMLSGNQTSSINFIENWDTAMYDENGDVIPGTVTRSDSSITHPSNGIYFQNIKDLVVTEQKDLFVLDTHHKIIFKFDISGATTLDESILKNDTPGRLLIGLVGDDGDLDDKVNFLNPVCLATVSNELFLLDQDPQTKRCVVKVYDSHLNWVRSYNLGVFDSQDVVDMEYNDLFDKFYIVTHTNTAQNIPKITEFDSNFNWNSTKDLLDPVRTDLTVAQETYLKIYFSEVNKNILYVLTDKNLYKKYVSRPVDFIGRIKFEEKVIGTTSTLRQLTDLCIYKSTIQAGDEARNKDEILLFEEDWNTIYRFLEDSGFENSLESEVDSKVLMFDRIEIKPDENVDIVTYNKALYKTLYNNLTILENISRKFATYYDDIGISQYLGFQYLNIDELEMLKYNITPDNYVSNNEIVLTETVNRCLRRVFDLQNQIISNMREKSINVYPDPSKVIKLT